MTKRVRILNLVKEGKTTKEISEELGYPISTIRYYREDKKDRNTNRVAEHRRKIKRKAIDYSGGRCLNCEYNKCESSLNFHHIDPKEKEIDISKGNTRSWSKIKEEVDKTILVCRNCHGEIHAGLWQPYEEIKKQEEFRKNYIDKPLVEYRDDQTSIIRKPKSESPCLICNKLTKGKYCSRKCVQKGQEKIEWPDNLAEMVIKSSKRKVAALLGVSDKAIAKRLIKIGE